MCRILGVSRAQYYRYQSPNLQNAGPKMRA
ncbi:Transposase [Lacticaseibacillus paracasei]|nr:Transposase [Lacticaseibacillus paracasei]AEA52989.1 Transposase [Lacticaseibacillus paracasei]